MQKGSDVMRSVVLALLFALLSLPVSAQTTNLKLAWDQPLATGHTFADVQGSYAYTLKVDASAPTLMAVTCVNGTPVKCTAPLPSMPSGPHTLVLTVTNGFGSASSSPLSGAPPSAGVNVSVTVVVTVP